MPKNIFHRHVFALLAVCLIASTAFANHTPIIDSCTASTFINTTVSGHVFATDADGDALTYKLKYTSEPGAAVGTVSVASDGTWTFTPAPSIQGNPPFQGWARFHVSVYDPSNATDSAQVNIYVAPLPKDVTLTTSTHPRLLGNAATFDAIAISARSSSNRFLNLSRTSILATADQLIAAGLQSTSYGRCKQNIASIQSAIETLAMAYRLTNNSADPKFGDSTNYLGAAKNQLNTLANWSDWYPTRYTSFFHDTGALLEAAAIGYDWLYNDLTPVERQTIRQAIYTKGFTPGVNEMKSPIGWALDDNNPLGYCTAPILLAGLVFDPSDSTADGVDYAAATGDAVSYGCKTVARWLGTMSTDGGYWESTFYWSPIRDLARPFSSMPIALGTDFGITDVPGLDQTGFFPLYQCGTARHPSTFGDSSTTALNNDGILWLSTKFNSSAMAWMYFKNCYYKGGGVFSMLYYSDKNYPSDTSNFGASMPAPLDKIYKSYALSAAFLHTSLQDANGPDTFVMLKGGKNGHTAAETATGLSALEHTDLDLGTFIFDALGVRWAEELGLDNYGLANYFNRDLTLTPNRWDYYRKRAEGQNTLLINPGDGPEQAPDAQAVVLYKTNSIGEPIATVDLTDAYTGFNATQVTRGVHMLSNRTQLLIQDEITNKYWHNDIYWNMHYNSSQKTFSIVPQTNSRVAELTMNDGSGRKLRMQILSPAGAAFTDAPATSLSSTVQARAAQQPVTSGPKDCSGAQTGPDYTLQQDPNSDFRKVVIHIDPTASSLNATITVWMVPLNAGDPIPTAPAVTPISSW